MLDIEQRIRRIYQALDAPADKDFSAVQIQQRKIPGGGTGFLVDFNQGANEDETTNKAFSVIHNIASIKDHLKVWCQKNSKEFKGEELINTNRDVAIVHDLWNIEKHAELDRKPRSGCTPKLQNLRRSLRLAGGEDAMFAIGVFTGKVEIKGRADRVIEGDIVDENGGLLGTFGAVCDRATTAWEQVLTEAGVPLPTP